MPTAGRTSSTSAWPSSATAERRGDADPRGPGPGHPRLHGARAGAGEASRADARCDVYSLGVVLYELLTGERPFRGQVRMVLAQVLDDEPRPPRRLDDGIPRDLETICLKAMAREPSWRYPTAGAMGEDLRRFVCGEPVTARPLGPAGRLWRRCRRRPAASATAAALALAVVLGLAGTTWQWRRAEAHALEVERQRARVKRAFAPRPRDRPGLHPPRPRSYPDEPGREAGPVGS